MTLDNFNKNSNFTISLGIVVYNTSLIDIEECFISIKNSSIKPRVYILCNSENRLYQIKIEELCIKYLFEYIKSDNHGFGHGHNQIVSLISTEWYICCNPDIKLDTCTIENLIIESQNLKNPIQIAPKILNPDKTIQKLSKKHLTLFTWLFRQMWRICPLVFVPYEEKFDYDKMQNVEFVSGCFFLIKSELYRNIGGFSEEFFLYCEDADFSRRATNLGFNYYVPSAYIIHKWSKVYVKSFHYLKIVLASLFKYFKKHGVF